MAWEYKGIGWEDEDLESVSAQLSGTDLLLSITLKDGTAKNAAVTLTPSAVGLPTPAELYAGNAIVVGSDGASYVFGGAPVTSVNGQSGAVAITKSDLGLSRVVNARQMPLGETVKAGADLNELKETGCYWTRGTASSPMTNAPTSTDNTASDCDWFVFVMNRGDTHERITQMAVSMRGDCAVCLRNYSEAAWGSWKAIA